MQNFLGWISGRGEQERKRRAHEERERERRARQKQERERRLREEQEKERKAHEERERERRAREERERKRKAHEEQKKERRAAMIKNIYAGIIGLMAYYAGGLLWRAWNEDKDDKNLQDTTTDLTEDKLAQYFEQGQSYVKSGQYEKALAAFNESIILAIDLTMSIESQYVKQQAAIHYLNRGVVYFYLQQYGNAIRDFNQSISLNETQPESHYYRGLLRYLSTEKSKYYDDILADLKAALEFSPNKKEVIEKSHYIQGCIYQLIGHENLARINFEKIISNAKLSSYKALAMIELGYKQAALDLFNDAVMQEEQEEGKLDLFDIELLQLQRAKLKFAVGSDLDDILTSLNNYDFKISYFQHHAKKLKTNLKEVIKSSVASTLSSTATPKLSTPVPTISPIPLSYGSTSSSISPIPVVTPASVSLTPEVTPTSVSSTTIATPVLDNCSFEEGSEIAMQDNFNIKTPEKSVSTLSTLYLGVAFGGGLFLFVLLGILIYRKFYHKHETKKSLHRVIACRDAKPDSSLQFRKGDILEVLEEQKEGVLLCYIAGNPEQQGRVREKFINRVIEIETFPRNVCVVESYEAANNELSIIKGDYLTVTGVGANGNWLMCHAYQSKPEEQTKQACVPKSSVLAIDLKNKYGLMDKDKLKVLQQQEQQRELKEIKSKLAQERQQKEEKGRALEAKKLELIQERKQKKEKKKALEAKKSELVQERQQKEDKERELKAKKLELVQERQQKERALEEKNSKLVQERQQREEKERALEVKDSELVQERQKKEEKERELEAKDSELEQEKQQRKEKEKELATIQSKLEVSISALLPIIPSDTVSKEEFPLAQGSYGFVYRGEWLGETIVLKELINPNLTNNAIAEFKEEALTMARLRSPYVVTVYGITLNAQERLKGIVMEYMEGGSLDRILNNKEIALSWLIRHKMALAVARGLLCLHQQNIIHNDLKSPNVLVRHYGDEWKLKLTDFGISKIKQETANFTGQPQGTAAFMAPEVFETNDYSPKSDVYAYGIVLWEIVSRDIPFACKKFIQIGRLVCDKKERPPISPEAPSSLTTLMQLCWKQNKTERLPTEDIITKLEALPLKQELREFDDSDFKVELENQRINKSTPLPQWNM